MAIGRLSMKVGKAGKAGPHAAYIAREGQYADRLERGEKLEATAAGNMPAWAQSNPLAFWQAADAFERTNGTTYREMEIALPRELSTDQRAALRDHPPLTVAAASGQTQRGDAFVSAPCPNVRTTRTPPSAASPCRRSLG